MDRCCGRQKYQKCVRDGLCLGTVELGRPHPLHPVGGGHRNGSQGQKPHLRRRLVEWPDGVSAPQCSSSSVTSAFHHDVSPTEPHFCGLVRNVTIAVKCRLMKSGTSCSVLGWRHGSMEQSGIPEGRWEAIHRGPCMCVHMCMAHGHRLGW